MSVQTEVAARSGTITSKSATAKAPTVSSVEPVKKVAKPKSGRMSVQMTASQQAALERLAASTGLQKVDLIREAVGLLTVAHTAWSRNLEIAIVDDEDRVIKHIISTAR
jgi:hypothetical protein